MFKRLLLIFAALFFIVSNANAEVGSWTNPTAYTDGSALEATEVISVTFFQIDDATRTCTVTAPANSCVISLPCSPFGGGVVTKSFTVVAHSSFYGTNSAQATPVSYDIAECPAKNPNAPVNLIMSTN